MTATEDEVGPHSQAGAIDACNNKLHGGHNDWFLPTTAQITLLFTNRYAVDPANPFGGFTVVGNDNDSVYWSSTLNPDQVVEEGIAMNFFSGVQAGEERLQVRNVRCIRHFNENP